MIFIPFLAVFLKIFRKFIVVANHFKQEYQRFIYLVSSFYKKLKKENNHTIKMAESNRIYIDRSLEDLVTDNTLRKQLPVSYAKLGECLGNYMEKRTAPFSEYRAASERLCRSFKELLGATGINSSLLAEVYISEELTENDQLDNESIERLKHSMYDISCSAYETTIPFADFIKAGLTNEKCWQMKDLVEKEPDKFLDLHLKIKQEPDRVSEVIRSAGSLDILSLVSKLGKNYQL